MAEEDEIEIEYEEIVVKLEINGKKMKIEEMKRISLNEMKRRMK